MFDRPAIVQMFVSPANYQVPSWRNTSLSLQNLANIVKGFQEMTHLVKLQEFNFSAYDLGKPGDPLISRGCFSNPVNCPWPTPQPYQSQAVQGIIPDMTEEVNFANDAPADTSASDSGSIGQARPTFVIDDPDNHLFVNFSSVVSSVAIQPRNYADLATQALYDMLAPIARAGGDTFLPLSRGGPAHYWRIDKERLPFPNNDLFMSAWAIDDPQTANFTLGALSRIISLTWDNMKARTVAESSMNVWDGRSGNRRGWMCLSYQYVVGSGGGWPFQDSDEIDGGNRNEGVADVAIE